jgi:hypothetical protein
MVKKWSSEYSVKLGCSCIGNCLNEAGPCYVLCHIIELPQGHDCALRFQNKSQLTCRSLGVQAE